MRHPFARCSEALPGLRELAAQHPHGQPRADAGEVPKMRVRIGLQAAGQGEGRAVQPLPRNR